MTTPSLRSVAALALWAATSACARADETASRCAPALNGSPLGQVSLFDGPVSDNAELAPDRSARQRNEWTGLAATGRPVFLVCRYAGNAQPLQFRLSPGVSHCIGALSRDGQSYRSLTCR